jgi:hypothetical protein
MDRSVGADRRHVQHIETGLVVIGRPPPSLELRHAISGERVRPLVQFVVRAALDPAPLDDAPLGGASTHRYAAERGSRREPCLECSA